MKTIRLILIFLAVIIALPLAGRLFWILKRGKPVDIVIINKSVLKSPMNEVKTLNFTLNFNKFVKKSGDLYDFKTDYLGYYPDASSESKRIKTFKLEEISTLSDNNDALFFIDNSGVKIDNIKKKLTKSSVYGGFNQNDYALLKEMINKHKLVVAEYNFFSSPTEDLVRYNTEQFLDVYSLSWTGKFFEDLSREGVSGEIATSWFDFYKLNNSADWDFSGPGLILLNFKQNRIIVLPAQKYMESEFPSIITNIEYSQKYNLPEKIAYNGWFEVSYEGKNNVISHFNLNLNTSGAEILRSNGLEPEFPAVIFSERNKFYYFAGDFSKTEVCLPVSKLSFFGKIIFNVKLGNSQNPDNFFKLFYNPLLTKILSDYYTDSLMKK